MDRKMFAHKKHHVTCNNKEHDASEFYREIKPYEIFRLVVCRLTFMNIEMNYIVLRK